MTDSPVPRDPLPSFAELGEQTRQRIQIVVLHDPREDILGVRWMLSLTDGIGRPVAREPLLAVGDEPPLPAVDGHLLVVGLRAVGDWHASPDRLRHYSRVAPGAAVI